MWITDNDVVVHMLWREDYQSNVSIIMVTPFGPSSGEVKQWVEAHTAQFTMEEFMKIRVGMSLDDVLETIGSYGELQSEELVDGQVIQTYGWTNGDGSTASIIVNQDGVVIKKIQEGLR